MMIGGALRLSPLLSPPLSFLTLHDFFHPSLSLQICILGSPETAPVLALHKKKREAKKNPAASWYAPLLLLSLLVFPGVKVSFDKPVLDRPFGFFTRVLLQKSGRADQPHSTQREKPLDPTPPPLSSRATVGDGGRSAGKPGLRGGRSSGVWYFYFQRRHPTKQAERPSPCSCRGVLLP